MSTENDDQLHDLAAPYALDALSEAERRQFEEHLAGCASCRDEVASFHDAVAEMAVDEVPPPADMRADVLASIADVEQLPSDAAAGAESSAGTHSGNAPGPAGDEPLPRNSTGRRRRIAAAALALAAAVAVIVLVANPWGAQQPTQPVAQQVLGADDAQRFDEAAPDGRITVVMSPSMNAAVVETDRLDPAPSGHAYQAWWLPESGDPISAGLVATDTDQPVLLQGDPEGATAVALTIEPEGGSTAPTSDPIHLVEMG